MAVVARLLLFGVPALEQGAHAQTLPFERRSQLLALLALDGGWVGRRDAAALLWPDQDGRLAATNLRKTLFRLAALPWGGLVQAEGGSLRFDGGTDIADFEQALRDGRPADAVALRRGDLLAGFDDDANEAWTERLAYERERQRAAWRAAALAWLQGDVPGPLALTVSAQLLEIDPFDEAAMRAHAGWLARTGQASASQQVVERYVQRLDRELGLAPSAQLLSLQAAPAPAALATPPPAPVTASTGGPIDAGFVGRGAELRRIASLLEDDDCRLLSLIGPGGIGKTRLARRALQELGAGFADGTAWVSLEDLPAGSTLGDALARALALRTDGRQDALDAVATALQPRQLLLAVDNLESRLDQAAGLATLLQRCPRLKLLVTSRVRLALAEAWTFGLQGLPCPDAEDLDRVEAFDAVQLFVRAARRVQPDFAPQAEAAAIADICRRLDGLPLALELAASWVRVLSCSQIAHELAAGPELLQADDAAHPPRHASIERVFDQSWQQLAAAERDVLLRLAAFRGGFTASAARAAAQASMAVLARLVDGSLLHKDEQRLRLHPLVQQLVDARCDERVRRERADAHAAYFLQTAARLRRAAGFGDRDVLREIDVEQENLRAAWRHAATEGPAAQSRGTAAQTQARLLADAALALMSHSDHRGQSLQGLRVGRWAVDSAAARAHPPLRAVLLAACAHLEHRLDRDTDAEHTATQALAAAGETEGHDARALALKVLGMVTMRLGRLDDSRRHHEQGLRLADELRDPEVISTLLGNLALVERRCGRHDEAARLLQQAALEHHRRGDHAREARALNNLGALLCDRRLFEPALGHFRAALALCERQGLQGTLGMVLGNLCYASLESGDLAAAEQHGRRALAQLAAVGDRVSACSVHHSMALLALQRRDPPTAAAELASALRIARDLALPLLQLLSLVVWARWLDRAGDRPLALAVLHHIDLHPDATAPVKVQAEHTRALIGGGTAEAQQPPSPAAGLPTLPILLQRLIDEAATEFQPFRRQWPHGGGS